MPLTVWVQYKSPGRQWLLLLRPVRHSNERGWIVDLRLKWNLSVHKAEWRIDSISCIKLNYQCSGNIGALTACTNLGISCAVRHSITMSIGERHCCCCADTSYIHLRGEPMTWTERDASWLEMGRRYGTNEESFIDRDRDLVNHWKWIRFQCLLGWNFHFHPVVWWRRLQ